MIDAIEPRLSVAWLYRSPREGRGRGSGPRRLLVLSQIIFLLGLITGCAGTSELANPPRLSLADLRLIETNLMEQRYAAKLRVQNPNNASLDVRGMEYTIYVNGRKFADGVSGRNFSVPAYGERIIEVNLTSTVLRVFEQLKSLSEGDSRTFRYRIAGSLSLAAIRGSIPFSHEDVLDLSAGAGG